MPWAGSDAASASLAKCGWRREPGKRRTSAMAWMRYSSSRPRNSSSGRVEWPMVQIVAGVAGIAQSILCSAAPLCMATWSVLSLLISYCGSSSLQWRGWPLYSVSRVCTLMILPLTWPASEFQRTWSPTLNAWLMVDVSPDVTRPPLNDAARAGGVSALQDALGTAAEGGDQAGDDPLRREVD